MNALLAPYRALNRARRALYRRGILKAKKLHRPVISIGNVAAGGTGKTPAVIAVCRFLASHGLRVAVLTRGYGRGDEKYSGIVESVDAGKYGDEPVLIKRSTSAAVFVGADRHKNGSDYECDVFVLDDGFQHLQLRRDLDLVIDAPARFYREGRSALEHADLVVPRRLVLHVPEQLRGQRVFAFAGLADNSQFFASLSAAGVVVAGSRSFPDHHRYTAADLESIRREARGATIVTTEKDAVKIDDPSIVAIGAEFVMPDEVLNEVLRVAQGAGSAAPSSDTPPDARRAKRKRRKSALVQRIEYAAYRFCARAVLKMPEERVHRWGTRLGALASRVLRGRDRLAMRNLREAFPEKSPRELRRTLDACWRHFGREVLLYLQMQNLSLEEVAARCPLVNRELLDESIARGNGTVLISAHWGGWEVAGLALMAAVQNVLTVARPLDNELLEADLQKFRERTGAEVVDRRKAARALLRGLAENAVVALLPDQAVLPREGVLVPFLGRPGWTTPAPAKMAIRANATIVFGFCIPDGLRHRLEFEQPILAAEFTDPVLLTERINDVISRRIREHPELWLWMHDRWKWTGESEVTNAV
ncbi:MAG TPA: tetraacyldisaccharide 4'-kinase [Thermoanaerobaculia bacterium]|nr:tetraacyldisaccharide 4'-kinase [Thermoanaerobaculia bacterium]